MSASVLVLSSAAGLRRHAAFLDDPLRALCGGKTSGWQISVLAAGGVTCLRCVHQLRRKDLLAMIEPRYRDYVIGAAVVRSSENRKPLTEISEHRHA